MRVSRYWVSACALALTACMPAAMTYDQFLLRFDQGCPTYYLIRDLPVAEQQRACTCMRQQVESRWPDMTSFTGAMVKLDRAPRGEGDFVPSAIRMTAEACQVAR